MRNIKISHRGNYQKKTPSRENSPQYIKEALKAGYYVEIDLWAHDGLYLGHDAPQYKIDYSFLDNERFFVHCKNLEALTILSSFPIESLKFDYFAHDRDPFALTARQRVWGFPETAQGKNSIIVDLNNDFKPKGELFGVCSDIFI